MKRYIKENEKVLKFINNDKYEILKITPIKKYVKQKYLTKPLITSYCIIYEKMI